MTYWSIFKEKLVRNAAWKMHNAFPCGNTEAFLIEPSTTSQTSIISDLPVYTPYYFISPSQFKRLALWEKDIPINHSKGHPNQINLLFPAYYGLVLLNDYYNSKNPEIVSKALNQLQFLYESAKISGEQLRLEYNWELPKFHVKPPWIAGITQALAATLAIRTYRITNTEQLLEQASGYLGAMFNTVHEGGALRNLPEGGPWIEEYPGEIPSYVLNGFLFSLIAVLEGEVAGLDHAVSGRTLEDSLLKTIPEYICGKYLRYDRLTGKFCSPHYMGLHSLLFLHLYQLTNRPGYMQLARTISKTTNWELYFDSVGRKPSDSDRLWIQEQFGEL